MEIFKTLSSPGPSGEQDNNPLVEAALVDPAGDTKTLGGPRRDVEAPGQPPGDAPAPAELARDAGTSGGQDNQPLQW